MISALPGVEEAAVLSTCSRFEIYAAGSDERLLAESLIGFYEERSGNAGLAPSVRVGEDAVGHLHRVAAGLESWILGETEILGQVKAAYKGAQAAKTAGRTLNIAFQKAMACGKAVRTKTKISEGFRSIGGAAAMLTRKVFGDDGVRGVLIFGAGEMARSTGQHLVAKGIDSVRVANRTLSKAVDLAGTLGGSALSFDEGLKAIGSADVIVLSTAASDPIVDAARMREVMAERKGRSIFLIDLGVPRNADPAVADVEGVYLYDLDDLKRMVARSRGSQHGAVAQAESLVHEAVSEAWAKLTRPPSPIAT